MKKVTNFLRRTVFNKEWWSCGSRIPIGILVICIVVGIIIGPIVVCNIEDTTKATAEDYAPLYEQLDAIKTDFYNVFYMDNVEVTIKEQYVEITLKAEECKLNVISAKDSTDEFTINEIDNSLTIGLAILLGIILGSLYGALVPLIIGLGIVLIWSIKNFWSKRKR